MSRQKKGYIYHTQKDASRKLENCNTYVGYTHKTYLKQLNYSGLLLLESQHTQVPGPSLPGNHSEDVGFVGEGLLQSRSLGLNPRWLAAFSYSHFEGTVWDGHIIVCHLHYMEPCSKQQTKTYLNKSHPSVGNNTLYSRAFSSLHIYLLYHVIEKSRLRNSNIGLT